MVSIPAKSVASLRAHCDRQNFVRQSLEDAYRDLGLVFATARLGHASIQVTADLYTHPTQDADREAGERFASAVRRRGSS